MQDFPKWNLNVPHRTNLANITGQYSCRQNSRNYISDVTFNYFYSDSREIPRIKADVLIPVSSPPYDSWCATFDFLVVFNGRRFIVRASGTKISYHRWSDIAHVVREWYIFSPDLVQIATYLASNESVQHGLFWIIYHRRFPCLSPCFVEGC